VGSAAVVVLSMIGAYIGATFVILIVLQMVSCWDGMSGMYTCTIILSQTQVHPSHPRPFCKTLQSSLSRAHLGVRVLGNALHGVRPGRQLLGADLVLVAPRAQAEVGPLNALVMRADHLLNRM